MYEICTCVLGIGIREHGLSFRVFLILKLYLFPILLLLTYGKFPHLSSVQFSHAVMSDSLRPHGLQHTRPNCPSPISRACSNSCPLSQWCHPTISSFVVPFSSCFQSSPASGSFPMSQFFASGGQIWSFSISLSNEYSGLISFRINWLDPPAVQGTLKHLLQHHSSKA